MKSSLVSVIVPCYNQAQFLPDAIESIVTQTYHNWECVIINDGSPDNTSDVARQLIAKYPNNKISLIEKELDEGVAMARNSGILKSTGKYILPVDADDMIAPFMLEKTVKLLEANPHASIAYTDAMYFGVGGSRYMAVGEFKVELLATNNQLSYCALYRRNMWENVGGYFPYAPLSGYEDWEFWISCASKGFEGLHIHEPLFFYRVREVSAMTKVKPFDAKFRAQIVLHHPELYTLETKQRATDLLRRFESE